MWSHLPLFCEFSSHVNSNPYDQELCMRAKYFPTQISQEVQCGHAYSPHWPTESCLDWKWLLCKTKVELFHPRMFANINPCPLCQQLSNIFSIRFHLGCSTTHLPSLSPHKSILFQKYAMFLPTAREKTIPITCSGWTPLTNYELHTIKTM